MSRYDMGHGLGAGACGYGRWDALAMGLGMSVGARARLGAIETHGDVSACACEVGHRARADGARGWHPCLGW